MEEEQTKNDDDSSQSSLDLFAQEEDVLVIFVHSGRNCGNNRNDSSGSCVLKLAQYGSNHDQWGIHSTVWDGGLALLAFLLQHQRRNKDEWKNWRVLDLGSGTGIVGLGVAAASAGQCAVALTDLRQAVGLLDKNCYLNAHHWASSISPVVHELSWGESLDHYSWLHSFLHEREPSRQFSNHNQQQQEQGPETKSFAKNSANATTREEGTTSSNEVCPRHLVIAGADIVYRPSLFEPLLRTLTDLSKHNFDSEVHIWLACQSIRTHLQEFCQLASDSGFSVDLLALVNVPDNHKCHVERLLVQNMTTSDWKNAPVRPGCVWILELQKQAD